MALNGHPEKRLPNTLSIRLPGVSGSEVLAAAPEVAASTGSACHEGKVSLSPVLEAMGVGVEAGAGTLRLTLGRPTTVDEVDRAVESLVAAWKRTTHSNSSRSSSSS